MGSVLFDLEEVLEDKEENTWDCILRRTNGHKHSQDMNLMLKEWSAMERTIKFYRFKYFDFEEMQLFADFKFLQKDKEFMHDRPVAIKIFESKGTCHFHVIRKDETILRIWVSPSQGDGVFKELPPGEICPDDDPDSIPSHNRCGVCCNRKRKREAAKNSDSVKKHRKDDSADSSEESDHSSENDENADDSESEDEEADEEECEDEKGSDEEEDEASSTSHRLVFHIKNDEELIEETVVEHFHFSL